MLSLLIAIPIFALAAAGCFIGAWIKTAEARKLLVTLALVSAVVLTLALVLGAQQTSLFLLQAALGLLAFSAGLSGPALFTNLRKALAVSILAAALVCFITATLGLLALGALYR